VRLLDLIQERWNRVFCERLPSDTLFVVTDIPGEAPISRATECFSMNSGMQSSHAASSSKELARARASSVFPTPVGPMKMKEPMGRLICSPGPALLTALETATMASSWPTHPLPEPFFHVDQFLDISSSILDTGMPSILETTSATSSSSLLSLSIFWVFWSPQFLLFLSALPRALHLLRYAAPPDGIFTSAPLFHLCFVFSIRSLISRIF